MDYMNDEDVRSKREAQNMDAARPGRLGSSHQMVLGSLPRNARMIDHTTSTSASESAQASRLPPPRSRMVKGYGSVQKRGLPQYRCCSADRPVQPPPPPPPGRTPTNASSSLRTSVDALKRPAGFRQSNAALAQDSNWKTSVSGAASPSGRAVPDTRAPIVRRDSLRGRSQSRTRVGTASYSAVPAELVNPPAPTKVPPRNLHDDFVYGEAERHRRCPCCHDVGAASDLEDILWTLDTLKAHITKLETRVMSILKFDNLSPSHKPHYRSEREQASLHARHSSMHPSHSRVDSTRRRFMRSSQVLYHDEFAAGDAHCDCADSSRMNSLRRDLYDGRDNCWMQGEGDYDLEQVEWEEEEGGDFMGGQAFSQPAESIASRAVQNQENLLATNAAGERCTSAGVALEAKRALTGDKRMWHIQQARHLLQTLPTSDELTTGVFSDSKRTAKSSGGKPTADEFALGTDNKSGGSRLSAPKSAVATGHEAAPTQHHSAPADHLLIKRLSGALDRVNTSDCVEVRRQHLSKQNTTALQVNQSEVQQQKEVTEDALLKNAISNRSERNKSSTTPKSDTSASCFSGYFPVNQFSSTAAKPVCVPALGLGAKALPASAWLSGEATQGETYGN
eukprot:Gregarina_sp_Pseudo_9__5617@NODE_773_length_2234_cov_27_578132_g728_i0_p1_GENE_NODE_773_length_2234_cov_27_578132_g728_i0NODE_773_length_2234_cov_27_578132_g728_i0_p1_ORF_typecomplete_len621_score121_24_NODE_773_length_2234_cov_27_578132_g728_i0781940